MRHYQSVQPGHTRRQPAAFTTIAFNKPYGVLTQFTSEGSDKETLASFGFPPNVYPIGRLDYDSEGLLLLSNDSSLNARLLHPRHGHERTYLVQVENIPDEKSIEALKMGVEVQGQRTLPAKVNLLEGEPALPEREVSIRVRKNIPTSWLELTITEGRNRQVRRMCAAVGHPALRLVRIAIGALRLDDLGIPRGERKVLTPDEIALTMEQSGA